MPKSQKSALLFGTHSFMDAGTKVGLQHVAEGLANAGWQVDYVATASSPFDVWGRKRHNRLKRVWLHGQDRHGVSVAKGLTEYSFKAFFPAHRTVMREPWQLACNLWLAPAWLRSRNYDLCIHETSPNVVYWSLVTSKYTVFRLNDAPSGFAHDLPGWIIQKFDHHLASNVYDDIWAVSAPLAQYAYLANASNNVATIPNGVAETFASPAISVARKPNSAVFIGALNHWLDDVLIGAVAQLLPEWVFDFYGPTSHGLDFNAPNVRVYPPIPPSHVPGLLAGYEVGLIPFRDTDNRMRFVERPLKFYEYLSAGLGVASVDIGSLKHGMAGLASYGSTPKEFAKAILDARASSQLRSKEFQQEFFQRHSWSSVMKTIVSRIEQLDSESSCKRSQHS